MTEDSATHAPPAGRTRYSTSHPEWVDNPLWEEAAREGWLGYALREHLGIELGSGHFCQDFSHSAYRETIPGPFWSWQRFGRTSTALPDGRVIHVAGEHEDAYDPDFCIYNDVVVEYPGGRREFYLYPQDVFPPTDFHTATLVGGEIVLIGSLGYRDLRRVGETQVLKLHPRTLRIETVATAGEAPGWISRHTAEKLGEAAILVIGGNVETGDGYAPNRGIFELDLATMTWRRREHGDLALFPVSAAVYRTSRNPRYGTANPQRSDNAFWLEMARRQWPPSRARLHFGDFAPAKPELILPDDLGAEIPKPGTPEAQAEAERISAAIDRSKLVRTIDDIVWTAVREEALQLTVRDGRKLLIGGEVHDYGDEYADPWVYNDVIVTHADGRIEILTYPQDVFPRIHWPIGVVNGDNVLIFGLVDRKHHPDRAHGAVALRLDTSCYEVAELPAPPARLDLYPGCDLREGTRIVFPVVRRREDDPELCVAFDPDRLVWSAPFPHPHPAASMDGD